MVEVFIVRPAHALGPDFLERDQVERFAEIKPGTLGYSEGSIQIPIDLKDSAVWPFPPVPGKLVEAKRAPLGAVKTLEDAQRLIEALRSELHNKNFVVERRSYPDADRVECHSFHPK